MSMCALSIEKEPYTQHGILVKGKYYLPLDLPAGRSTLSVMSLLFESEASNNGASVPALAPCPLDEHTKEHFQAVAEKIRQLEFRIASLEIHRDRLEHGLREAGKFVFDSPMSKLMLASIPKEKQQKLKEFFDVGSANGQKTR